MNKIPVLLLSPRIGSYGQVVALVDADDPTLEARDRADRPIHRATVYGYSSGSDQSSASNSPRRRTGLGTALAAATAITTIDADRDQQHRHRLPVFVRKDGRDLSVG